MEIRSRLLLLMMTLMMMMMMMMMTQSVTAEYESNDATVNPTGRHRVMSQNRRNEKTLVEFKPPPIW